MAIPTNPTLPMQNANTLLTTVQNLSSRTLTVVISAPDQTQLISLSAPTVAPNSLVTIMSQYFSDGNTVNVGLWDPETSTSGSVASFIAHQKDQTSVFGRGTEPWVDTYNYVNGYSFGQTQVASGQVRVQVTGGPSSAR